MENSGFELDAEKSSLELKGVKVEALSKNNSHSHQCQPDLCRSLHAKYLEDKSKMMTSPWDGLKTRFLVGIIAILGLWVLLYFASSKLGFL